MNTKELHSLMIAYIYGQKKFTNKYDLEAISQIPKSAKPNSYLTQIKRLVKIFFIPHNILKEISLFIKRNKPMHVQITAEHRPSPTKKVVALFSRVSHNAKQNKQ